MRVLHVIPSVAERSGGPAMAIVPMCRALMEQGMDVLLVTTNSGLREDEVAGCDYKGVPAKFFASQLGESFKYSRPLSSWLTTNIDRFDVAHIHAVFNHSSVAAARICKQSGTPYVIRPLGTLDPWSMTRKSLRKRFFWQLAGQGMLQHAAAVHYTTEAEKAATENLTRMNHGKVIPLGIEAGSDAGALEDCFPELARGPYVLVLSRLHPKKALEVLIAAFHLLIDRPQFRGWTLVLAGDGPAYYVAKLKRQAAAGPQPDSVVFTGWLEGEKKDAVLRRASLLALPSHQENFGLCVMEAMSRSVPVLVSPSVNLAPEIAAANAGWIAAIDRDALAAKLAEALSDKKELAQRGRAGKELSQKYSWESVARSLVELYREIVQTRGGR
jgi:glycosyltransferase involved in cell wall biosynthesis